MVELYSPSGEEKELAEFLSSEMRELGFEVKQDSVGNVIGKIGEGEPKVLLCGHMDTVPPELPVKIENGFLYGRGSVDAKGPLAALIIAASQMIGLDHEGSLIVVAAVDEEGKSTGVKNLINNRLVADYAIFGEPTDVDTITVGYRGSLLLSVICETSTGHSSAPWLYENSIEKTLELWNLIKTLKNSTKMKQNSHFNSISFCLRQIEGGGESSVVPSRCRALIEARIPPNIKVEEIISKIDILIDGYKRKNLNVKINTEILDHTEPYITNKKSPLVRALSHSIWRHRNVPVKIVNKTGTGDMNIYGNATGKLAVTYGPGDPHLDHTPHERIKLQDYLDSIYILKGTLENLLRLRNKT